MKCVATSVMLVAAVLAPAGAQTAPGGYRISADVDQVVLPVTVVDHRGRRVAGLSAGQFHVYQDGRPQRICYFSHRDVPVTVGLVVDNSSSMSPKHGDTVLAALSFLRLSNPADEVFLVGFNEHVRFGLAEPFSSDPGELRAALLRQRCLGKTALYDAVAAALRHVVRGSRDKKALIVVSDGGDNASRETLDDVLELARKSDVIIYTIGLFDTADMDQRPRVLKKLARMTGGEAFLPDTPRDLGPICRRIAEDLRTQYTLAYTPDQDSRDGRYHRIRVVAQERGKKLVTRTRAGYWGAPESATGGRGGQ